MSKVSMGIEDVLFYADLRRSVVPTVGGLPTFTRNGTAYGKSIEAYHRIHMIDTPRIEPDGLRLELAQTNQLSDPFDAQGASWSATSISAEVAVTSLYAGETAYKITTSAEGGNEEQTAGTLTGSPETFYADVEQGDVDRCQIGLWDNTALDYVARIELDFSDGSVTLEASGVGTSVTYGAIKLADVGPNGGVVYRLWLTATPDNSGNTRIFYLFPSRGSSSGTGSTIFHAAQHVEAGLFTSPVDGTRATETFYWSDPPPPQGLVCYLKFRAGAPGGGGVTNVNILRVADTNPVYEFYWSSTTATRMLFSNGTASTQTSAITVTPSPNDLIEMVGILSTDQTGRFVVRKNGATVSAQAMAAPASGSFPTAWGDAFMTINSTNAATNKGAHTYQQLKIVKLSATHRATDGSDDDALMDEMAGLYALPDASTIVSSKPFVEKLTNTTFDSNLSSWTTDTNGGGGSIDWEDLGGADAGSIKFTQGGSSVWMKAYQSVSLSADKYYVISGERPYAEGSTSRIGVDTDYSDSTPDEGYIEWTTTETGLKKTMFQPSADGDYYLTILEGGAASVVTNFDNVSLKEFDS